MFRDCVAAAGRRVAVDRWNGQTLNRRINPWGAQMRVFWNDCGRELTSNLAREVDLHEAGLIWSDDVRGVQGNFLGLIDDQQRTVQFYFEASIPDDVDDASHLRIVLIDFPQLERGGSYGRRVAICEVHGLIEMAFKAGADHRQFGELTFTPW